MMYLKRNSKLVRNKEREMRIQGFPTASIGNWELYWGMYPHWQATPPQLSLEARLGVVCSQATPPRLSLEPDWGHSNCGQTMYRQTTANVTSVKPLVCWPWKWYTSDVIMPRDSYCKHASFASVMWLKIFKWQKPALWCSCGELFDVGRLNLWLKACSGVWFRFLKMIVSG